MASKAPKATPYHPRHRRTWLRRPDRRRHQPPPTVAAMLTALPALRRPDLASIAHRAIDRMDEIDGDPDREEDDWPGGNVEDEGQMWFVVADSAPTGLPAHRAAEA